jgi:hypothetical protein
LRPRLTTGLPFSLAHECACLPALLPKGDEFRMNFEAVSVSSSVFLLFLETFAELGAHLAENVGSPSIAPEQAASGRSHGLGLQGSPKTSSRYYQNLM